MGVSLTAVALVLALGLVWWIGATLVGPISASRSRLVALAQGNLADPVCVMGHGELREMTASLDSAVRSMRVAVAPIRLGAAQLAISVKEQAGALHYMASNAEETSAQVQMVSVPMCAAWLPPRRRWRLLSEKSPARLIRRLGWLVRLWDWRNQQELW